MFVNNFYFDSIKDSFVSTLGRVGYALFIVNSPDVS